MNAAAKTLKFDDPCWLQAGKDVDAFNKTDPFNKQPLSAEQLVPNTQLKAEIEAWKASQRLRAQPMQE